MESFNLLQCKITDGFFADLQKLNAEITIKAVYHRFKETGRFDALKCKKSEKKTHIYWDSDIAKWLEAAACLLTRKKDAEIEEWYDEAVNDIVQNQLPCGYFNSYFQVYEPENIYTRRDAHELYCAGHLFEAAVVASKYLKDDRLFRFAEKYVDYIYVRFVEKQDTAFTTPGHEEIELALMHLFAYTGNEKYKKLAEFFLNQRGARVDENCLPVRSLEEAEGHAVRVLYRLIAMSDLARENDEKELLAVTENLFKNITEKKMYITGGVGSTHYWEEFTPAYDLPNLTAYAETCASIALALFADRMQRQNGMVNGGDVFERVLYNGLLSGVSLDGDKFFYVNPLEMQKDNVKYRSTLDIDQRFPAQRMPILERVKVFWCSCCPPNICRFIEELPQYIWYKNDNELVLSQLISSRLISSFADAEVVSDFPYSGKIKLKIDSHGKMLRLKIRKPAWCDETFLNEKDGYLCFEKVFQGEELVVEFPMKLRKIYANPYVDENAGKVALSYGPLILCAESIDNDFPLSSVRIGEVSGAKINILQGQKEIVEVILPIERLAESKELYSYEKNKNLIEKLRLIPYFSWANRGKADMKVWFVEK